MFLALAVFWLEMKIVLDVAHAYLTWFGTLISIEMHTRRI